MPLHIPELAEFGLAGITFCATIAIGDSQAIAAMFPQEEEEEMRARLNNSFGRVVKARFPEGGGHLHIEVQHETRFKRLPSTPNSMMEIVNSIDPFLGIEAQVRLHGAFKIQRNQLPARGFIIPLLGASAQRGEGRLVVSGVKVAVTGHDPFKKIECLLNQESGGVLFELEAFDRLVIHDECLVEASRTLQAGLDSLVMQREA